MNAPKHFSKAMINSLASHLLFRINLQCITYFSNYGVREGDFGAEPDAVEISYMPWPPYVACKPSACVPPQMGIPGSSMEMEYSGITYSVLGCRSNSGSIRS